VGSNPTPRTIDRTRLIRGKIIEHFVVDEESGLSGELPQNHVSKAADAEQGI